MQLEQVPWLLEIPLTRLDADRDRVVHCLRLIERNTIEQVVAAEQHAQKILTPRQARLKALAALLVDQGRPPHLHPRREQMTRRRIPFLYLTLGGFP
jgi:hypothetical protein